MSYSQDVVTSKLSSVNETQEAIVNISQWIMFHRRHADETARTWAKALGDAPVHRKLALIYLVNEVVQQSKARKRDEFLKAFLPIITESIESAYRATNKEFQAKIKRVVDVWSQREVFPPTVIAELQTALDDAGKKNSKQSLGGRRLGQGMSFGMGLPPELTKLATAHKFLTSRATQFGTSLGTATRNASSTIDAEALPAPDLYSQQIATASESVDKALNDCEAVIKARGDYISQLESILQLARAALESETKEKETLEQQQAKLAELEESVRDIMLTDNSTPPTTDQQLEVTSTEAVKSNLKSPLSAMEYDDRTPDPEYVPFPPGENGESPIPDESTPPATDSGLDTIEKVDPSVAEFLNSLGTKRDHVQNES
ncbi:RNA polymerase II-binding domain-containing protein [Lipomyces oligophaga]|uniref:RNA polymerase II-binding domain-containing protein n=1 Tax=Lipomyces oligophaga TaxID=45792 RepID=UPI0034CEF708